MNNEWEELYNKAMSVINPKQVSDSISVGTVGAAILSSKGNIYTGICIDTSSSLGLCAERNALTTMFTHGEFEIKMICSVYKDGHVMPPCGACREFMMQLNQDPSEIKILINNEGKSVSLKELMPEYPS